MSYPYLSGINLSPISTPILNAYENAKTKVNSVPQSTKRIGAAAFVGIASLATYLACRSTLPNQVPDSTHTPSISTLPNNGTTSNTDILPPDINVISSNNTNTQIPLLETVIATESADDHQQLSSNLTTNSSSILHPSDEPAPYFVKIDPSCPSPETFVEKYLAEHPGQPITETALVQAHSACWHNSVPWFLGGMYMRRDFYSSTSSAISKALLKKLNSSNPEAATEYGYLACNGRKKFRVHTREVSSWIENRLAEWAETAEHSDCKALHEKYTLQSSSPFEAAKKMIAASGRTNSMVNNLIKGTVAVQMAVFGGAMFLAIRRYC